MSWDDFKSPIQKNNVKDATFKSTNSAHFYCIFRIGDKHKDMNSIKHFERHMERIADVQNADKSIENEILIGNKNVYGDVKEYIKDCKLRKNSVIARELLQTASPDFFRGIGEKELEIWKQENIKWLKDNFGSNCIYSVLHKDEKTWHIHSLIIPKFKNKKNENILSNSRYFDGIRKMREWQSNYAKGMQEHFKSLNRGIKYSKAKHMTLKHYYTLVKQEINEKDIEQLVAKAKNSELLEIKIKAIEKTLEVYKNYNLKNILAKDSAQKESKELIKNIQEMKQNGNTYKEAISLLSQQYHIPMYAIKEAVKICENISEKELEK